MTGPHAATAQAVDYMLTRWPAITRFLDDGRTCLSDKAAERALRGVGLGAVPRHPARPYRAEPHGDDPLRQVWRASALEPAERNLRPRGRRALRRQRKPGPIIEAACWSHGRRHFFGQADLRKAPLAIEAVRRIDAIFAIEGRVNGQPSSDRRAVRQRETKRLLADLEQWMHAERARLSRR